MLRYKWTELLISTNVITKMHQLADTLKLKKKRTNTPLTVNTNNEEIAKNVAEADKEGEDYTQTIRLQNHNEINEDFHNAIQNIDNPMDLIDELSSKFMADNISEITTSQRSKERKIYKVVDLFNNSTIEDIEEFESSTINDDDNKFYEPSDKKDEEVKDDPADITFPYLDHGEIDEDTNVSDQNQNKEFQSNNNTSTDYNYVPTELDSDSILSETEVENDSTSFESEDDESDYTTEERSCEEERSERLPPNNKEHSYNSRSKKLPEKGINESDSKPYE